MRRNSAPGIMRTRTTTRGSYYVHIHKQPDLIISPLDLESSMPWHVAFLFLVPVLASVLQLHCQASNSSPFETHLPNMLAFLLAILLYCFALVYYVRNKRNPNAANRLKISAQLAIISGCLASASLISVMLPRTFEPIIFTICFFLSIYVARNMILDVGQSAFYHSKENPIHCGREIWRWISGSSTH